MSNIRQLKEVSKDIKVLYVEDEESVRSNMLEILNLFFNTVHTAEDGESGLNKFHKNSIDLIMTDIRMPKMDGLEMVKKIRETHPNVPVIITTAFNDEEYFIKSIDLKIEKYLIKPIEQDKAEDVFLSIAETINNRRKAKELELHMMKDKINKISNHIVEEITNSYQNPCVICSKDEVKYVNKTFLSLFDEEDLKSYTNKEATMDSLFDKRKGFIKSLSEYNEDKPHKNRVSISKKVGRKIFRVVRNEINIDEDRDTSYIYQFNDITLEEYQKIKITAYNERLEELIFNARYRNLNTKIQEESSINTPSISSDGAQKNKLVIGEDENSILRRSHIYKTSAAEYIAELDSDTIKQLQELDDLESDFSSSIVMFQEDKSLIAIYEMADKLERYAHEINLLFQFQDLAYAISSISKLLMNIDDAKLNENTINKIAIFLSGIQYDLSAWRKLIFIEQSAIDIHYLDSSLFSACLQIELVLSDDIKEIESEEDDLILF